MATCVLRDGEQIFELPFLDSYSTINITVTNVSRKVEFIDISSNFVSQPVSYRGAFECSDPELNKLWEVSRWVTQICMQTHHLDSPHHQEPISDPGDYLIESVVNYHCFGAQWLPRQDLRKFAKILKNKRTHRSKKSRSLK